MHPTSEYVIFFAEKIKALIERILWYGSEKHYPCAALDFIANDRW